MVHTTSSQVSPHEDDDQIVPIAWRIYLYYPQLGPVPDEPIAWRTLSHTANHLSPSLASGRCYLRQFLLDWAMPMLDEETGQSLRFRQLWKNLKYQKIGINCTPTNLADCAKAQARVPMYQTNNASKVRTLLKLSTIPKYLWRGVKKPHILKKFVKCAPPKSDTHCTCITIDENRIC